MPPRPARYQEGLDRPLAVALRVLRLRWPTSEEELLGAWRRAALETHPDRGGDPEEFKGVQEAREYVEKALGGLVPVEAPETFFDRMRKDRARRQEEESRKARDRFSIIGRRSFWGTSKKGNLTMVFGKLRLTIFPRGGAYGWCMAREEDYGSPAVFSPGLYSSEEEVMQALEELVREVHDQL